MQRFRTSTLDQPLLLSPSLHDWVGENSLARFLAEIVSELNLDPIEDSYRRKDGRGAAGYHPELLVRLLLYGYATGITSSRRMEKATYDMVPFRYLAADQHPDHDTIAAFRQRHLEELSKLFVQALELCQRAGLVKLANVAIDGTKLKANAGWGRGRSHAKMSEEEQKLKALVGHWMEQAQRTDAEEDARFGKGKKEEDLPAKLARSSSGWSASARPRKPWKKKPNSGWRRPSADTHPASADASQRTIPQRPCHPMNSRLMASENNG